VLQNRTVSCKIDFVNRLYETVRFCNTGFLPKTSRPLLFFAALFKFATLSRFATLFKFAVAQSYTVAFCNMPRCRVLQQCLVVQRAALLSIAAAFLCSRAAAAAAELLFSRAAIVCSSRRRVAAAAYPATAAAAAYASMGGTGADAAGFASVGRSSRRSWESSEAVGTQQPRSYGADFRPVVGFRATRALFWAVPPLVAVCRGGHLVEWDWRRVPACG